MFIEYGFIGLGSQGAPMAQRMIDAGLPVTLWARRPETLASFTAPGVAMAPTPEALAKKVDYIGICVVDDAGVREICDRLIPAMRPGSCIAIHSTVAPSLCQALAEEAAARGIDLIDAPVSGGGPGAAAGTLTVMVGGKKETFERARAVFETFASLIVHLGEVGAGQQAKLINNAMMAANLSIAWSGLQSANVFGLDREAFVELINASSGRSFSFGVAARMPNPKSFEHGARLLEKDVTLLGAALECAEPDSAACYEPIRNTASVLLSQALAE